MIADDCSPRAQLHLQRLLSARSSSSSRNRDTSIGWTVFDPRGPSPSEKRTYSDLCHDELNLVAAAEFETRRNLESDAQAAHPLFAEVQWLHSRMEAMDRETHEYVQQLLRRIWHSVPCAAPTQEAGSRDAVDGPEEGEQNGRNRRLQDLSTLAAEIHGLLDGVARLEQQLKEGNLRAQRATNELADDIESHRELLRESEARYDELLSESQMALEASRVADDEAAYWEEQAQRREGQLLLALRQLTPWMTASDTELTVRKCDVNELHELSHTTSAPAHKMTSDGEASTPPGNQVGNPPAFADECCRSDVDNERYQERICDALRGIRNAVVARSNDGPALSPSASRLVVDDDLSSVAFALLHEVAALRLLFDEATESRDLICGALRLNVEIVREARLSREEVHDALSLAERLVTSQASTQHDLLHRVNELERELGAAEEALRSERSLREAEVTALWNLSVGVQEENEKLVAMNRARPTPNVDASTQYHAADLLRTSSNIRRRSTTLASLECPPHRRAEAVGSIFRKFKKLADVHWGSYLPTVAFHCSKYPMTAGSRASPPGKTTSAVEFRAGSCFLVADLCAGVLRVHPCSSSRGAATPRIIDSHEIVSAARDPVDPTKVHISFTGGSLGLYFRGAFDRERCIEIVRTLADHYHGLSYVASMVPDSVRRTREPTLCWYGRASDNSETVETIFYNPAAHAMYQTHHMTISPENGDLLLTKLCDHSDGAEGGDGEQRTPEHHSQQEQQQRACESVYANRSCKGAFAVHVAASHEHTIQMVLLAGTWVPGTTPRELQVDSSISSEVDVVVACWTIPPEHLHSAGGEGVRTVDVLATEMLLSCLEDHSYIAALHVELEGRVFVVAVERSLLAAVNRVNWVKLGTATIARGVRSASIVQPLAVTLTIHETSIVVVCVNDDAGRAVWGSDDAIAGAPLGADLRCACDVCVFLQRSDASRSVTERPEDSFSFTTGRCRAQLTGNPRILSKCCVKNYAAACESGDGSLVQLHRVAVTTTRSHSTILDLGAVGGTASISESEELDPSSHRALSPVRVAYRAIVVTVTRMQLVLLEWGHLPPIAKEGIPAAVWVAYTRRPISMQVSCEISSEQQSVILEPQGAGGVYVCTKPWSMLLATNCWECAASKKIFCVEAVDEISSLATMRGSCGSYPTKAGLGEVPWYVRGAAVGRMLCFS